MKRHAFTLALAAASIESTALANDPSASFQTMVGVAGGDGLRFNDPYRLATPLGSSAESISRTAAYVDLALSLSFGDPRAFQHGASLRWSVAVEGVRQSVLAPGYLGFYRLAPAWAVFGRAAPAIVLSPDVTWGLEGSLGTVWFLRAGLGATLELVGDLFYGAATREVRAAAYPVASAQLGFVVAYEALR